MTEIIASTDDPEILQDAERIVRCRDCTKFSDGKRGIGYCQEFASDGKKAAVQRSGFCAWGEPRETGLHG